VKDKHHNIGKMYIKMGKTIDSVSTSSIEYNENFRWVNMKYNIDIVSYEIS
jgi:hypothetical protein